MYSPMVPSGKLATFLPEPLMGGLSGPVYQNIIRVRLEGGPELCGPLFEECSWNDDEVEIIR